MSRPGSIGGVQSFDNSFIDIKEWDAEDAGTEVQGHQEGVHGPVGQNSVEDVERQLDAGEIDGAALVKGASVDGASTAARELAKTATKRSLGSRMLSAIGRFLMGAAHAVKSFFTMDVLRPSWYSNNVVHFDHELKMRSENGELAAGDLEALPDVEDLPTVEFDKHLVAVGTGFGGKINAQTGKVDARIEVRKFSERKWRGRIYPAERPRLKDIIQNPALQDCWFLSGIAAVLSAKGPEAIERLIQKNDENSYKVRLGEHEFIVPNGEVCCNGGSCVSNSAPWVKILEQAAAMYMAKFSQTDMIRGGMGTALKLLSGGRQAFTPMTENVVDVNMLDGALRNHVPVVIGHVGSLSGFIDKVAGAMRDNISPGHAVTLLNVQRRGEHGEKAWLTVMDPYGRTRIISSSAIKRCTFAFGCTADEASLFKKIASDYGTGETVLKEV